jgi:hypothetical protein
MKLTIMIGVVPIEEGEFAGPDHRIPVFVIFGNDNLPGCFEINDSIVMERIFSIVQPGNDIHIFIYQVLFVWLMWKHCSG